MVAGNAMDIIKMLKTENNQLKAQLEDQRSDLTVAISKTAKERDQLKAQVERLRTTLDGFDKYENLNYAYHVSPFKDEVRKVLNETRGQSFAEIEAALLERVAKEWHVEAESVGARSVYADELIDKANHIRQQALENKP